MKSAMPATSSRANTGRPYPSAAWAAPGEPGDPALRERGLAGLLPAGNADDGRVAGDPLHFFDFAVFDSIVRNWPNSCGVLALKNGSMSRPQTRAGGNGTGTVPCRS